MDEFTEQGNLPAPSSRGLPFSKGNPGRMPGSKNRTTIVAEALLKGQEDELIRKAIELAKAGDGPMLKFLLDRLLPRERSVQFDLPSINSAADAGGAQGIEDSKRWPLLPLGTMAAGDPTCIDPEEYVRALRSFERRFYYEKKNRGVRLIPP